jgi:hypothetical protein
MKAYTVVEAWIHPVLNSSPHKNKKKTALNPGRHILGKETPIPFVGPPKPV